jgi:hypothetical protein
VSLLHKRPSLKAERAAETLLWCVAGCGFTLILAAAIQWVVSL